MRVANQSEDGDVLWLCLSSECPFSSHWESEYRAIRAQVLKGAQAAVEQVAKEIGEDTLDIYVSSIGEVYVKVDRVNKILSELGVR